MACDNQRLPLCSQLQEQLPHFDASFRIKPIGGLVEYQYFWIVQQRSCNTHSLLHTMRKAFDILVLHIRRIGDLHDFGNPCFAFPQRNTKDCSKEIQILVDPHVVVCPEPIRHVSNQTLDPRRILAAIHPRNRCGPRGGFRQPHENLDRGGLARTVRTDKPQDLPTINMDR